MTQNLSILLHTDRIVVYPWPTDQKPHYRVEIEVLRFGPAMVAVAEGLDPGEVVVTAGIQALHPGQKVRLLETPS